MAVAPGHARNEGWWVRPGKTADACCRRLLCDHQRRRQLRVNAGPGEGGVADVRLSLNSDPDSFAICETDVWMHLRLTSVFLPLIPPPGMSQRGGGSGGGGGSSHSQTLLRGELPVGDVESHYREQLIAAVCRLSEHTATVPVGLGTWDFIDDRGQPWMRLLTVAEPPGPDQRPPREPPGPISAAAQGLPPC